MKCRAGRIVLLQHCLVGWRASFLKASLLQYLLFELPYHEALT